MSELTTLIESGFLLGRELRSATLTYRGHLIPCTPGNLDFFEQLHPDGNGFIRFRNQHVVILRSEIPLVDAGGNPLNIEFQKGQNITVREDETGKETILTIGEINSEQPAAITLNLQTTAA